MSPLMQCVLMLVVVLGWGTFVSPNNRLITSTHLVTNNTTRICTVSILHNDRPVNSTDLQAWKSHAIIIQVEGPPYHSMVQHSFESMRAISRVPFVPLTASAFDPAHATPYRNTRFRTYLVVQGDGLLPQPPSTDQVVGIEAGCPDSLQHYTISISDGTRTTSNFLFFAAHDDWTEMDPIWSISDGGLQSTLSITGDNRHTRQPFMMTFQPSIATPWTNVQRQTPLG